MVKVFLSVMVLSVYKGIKGWRRFEKRVKYKEEVGKRQNLQLFLNYIFYFSVYGF